MSHEQPRRRLMRLRAHDNKHRDLVDGIGNVRLRSLLRRPQRPALIYDAVPVRLIPRLQRREPHLILRLPFVLPHRIPRPPLLRALVAGENHQVVSIGAHAFAYLALLREIVGCIERMLNAPSDHADLPGISIRSMR